MFDVFDVMKFYELSSLMYCHWKKSWQHKPVSFSESEKICKKHSWEAMGRALKEGASGELREIQKSLEKKKKHLKRSKIYKKISSWISSFVGRAFRCKCCGWSGMECPTLQLSFWAVGGAVFDLGVLSFFRFFPHDFWGLQVPPEPKQWCQ